MRRVGVLLALTENDPLQNARLKAFRLGMRDLEWIEGRNVHIEYRFAGANLASINQHVAELIRLAPDAIVANSSPVLAALRTATSTIPIVFVIVNDPVGQGFIPNLTHPGANIYGFSFIETKIVGKCIHLLRAVKADLSHVASRYNPNSATHCAHCIA